MAFNQFLIIYSNQFPKLKNILSVVLLLVNSVLYLPVQAMNKNINVTLQTYDVNRDKNAITKILNNSEHLLCSAPLWQLIFEKCCLYFSEKIMRDRLNNTLCHLINPKHTTYVARKNDKTVGFVNYQKSPNSDQGIIHILGVINKHRRQGIGTKLMEQAIDNLFKENKGTTIKLCTKPSLTGAIKLYEGLGFKKELDKTPEQMMIRKIISFNWSILFTYFNYPILFTLQQKDYQNKKKKES